jgi:hypothetical protein
MLELTFGFFSNARSRRCGGMAVASTPPQFVLRCFSAFTILSSQFSIDNLNL